MKDKYKNKKLATPPSYMPNNSNGSMYPGQLSTSTESVRNPQPKKLMKPPL